MRRIVALLVMAAACTPTQARIVKHLGIGLTAEGAAIGLVSQVTRDPSERWYGPAITAAPLLAPGLALWIIGCVQTRRLASAND